MPEISIITPVYQAEKFLKKCVDSILSQSFTGVISRLWTATISQRRIFWKHCIVWRKNMMPK